MTLAFIIAATAAGGVLSVLFAALIAFQALGSLLPRLVSFSAGALLGAAFLDLLPHAFSSGMDPHTLFATLLGGVLAFFLLEKFALWRHSHHHEHDGHDHEHGFDAHEARGSGLLILVGDSLHNFADGILIAAAFLADPWLGLMTTVAVIAHEVPQEAGDFIVLVNAGYSRLRALVYNGVASLASVIGGVLGYFALDAASHLVPFVVVLAAASFIYIAVADLIPWMHRRSKTESSGWQILMVSAGVGLIAVTHHLAH
ncbi:MAG: ZIP family metal transporter [Burkholderiales bacterium]|nr:ZIP family metal transporter [Burkholderiales bacterium]